MAPAANLQQFLLALVTGNAAGHVTTKNSDDPTSESERRQPFFFSAAGVPRILRASRLAQSVPAHSSGELQEDRPSRSTRDIRISDSRLSPGAAGIHPADASDLAEAMNMQATLADLAVRCTISGRKPAIAC